jgi:myo-inositol-1(or 4)-monophosphatase
MAATSPTIALMITAARKAGRTLRRDFGEVEELQVSRKGPADFVTRADQKAEEVIFTELNGARKGYSILMEERGLVEGTDKSHRFIVDPLDGTTNFLHAIPHYAVSIALERDGELVAGVVYNPISDDLYWAEKGTGAYWNDKRIRVAGRRTLTECIFATGIPFAGKSGHATFLTELHRVMGKTAGVRRFGAASLDLAHVAAGRFDGFWERGLAPWDVAAGIVIVREAGGVVRTIEGGVDMLEGGSICAANVDVIEPFRKMVLGE